MCLSLRNTLRRGRSGLPKTLLRTDHFRRWSRTCLSLFLSAICDPLLDGPLLGRASAGECLARLDLHYFALIPHALALIRLRLAHAAHIAGELPDKLLVRPAHMNLQTFNLYSHAKRNGNADRVGITN